MAAPAHKTAGPQAKEFGKRVAVEIATKDGVRNDTTGIADGVVLINEDGYIDARSVGAANQWNYVGAEAGITVDTVVALAAADADQIHCVDEIEVNNLHATIGTFVEIVDGASTVLWRCWVDAIDVPAKSFYYHRFEPPLRGAAINTAMNVRVDTASTIFVCARGHKETLSA